MASMIDPLLPRRREEDRRPQTSPRRRHHQAAGGRTSTAGTLRLSRAKPAAGEPGGRPPRRHNELTYGEADRRSATTLPRQFVSTSSSRASALSSLVFSASAS